MEKHFAQADEKISDYVTQLCNPEKDPLWSDIRHSANKNGIPAIQVGKMDGLHLEVLISAMGVQKAVEIGTLAGYSGVRILRGMKPGGKLYTFEFSEMHAKIAQENFKKAGFEKQVEILVGAATDNLPKINNQGPFDLVFIDADKINYPNYFDWAAKNLKVGGVLIADNVFAWGWIAENTATDPADRTSVEALQLFNKKVIQSKSFRTTMLPTAEGLMVAVKVDC